VIPTVAELSRGRSRIGDADRSPFGMLCAMLLHAAVMAKRILEYRCLLISPGDVEAERDAVSDVVASWNATIGETLDARVHLVRWETHGVPDASAPPQEVLNRQIVDECDFGIAIFWARLGTPTTAHESGSIEEIDRLRGRGARVLAYWNSAAIPQDRLKDDQYQRLVDFKKRLAAEGLLGSYRDIANLREQVTLHLTVIVAGLMQKDRGQPPIGAPVTTSVDTAPKPDVRVVVYPAMTYPPTPGVRHLLGIRVQNHSSVPVYISGISIILKTGVGLLLFRDAVTGAEQSRVVLRPGESLQWSANADELLIEHSPKDYVGVVVHDDIGREYRDPAGALATILEKWSLEDQTREKTLRIR